MGPPVLQVVGPLWMLTIHHHFHNNYNYNYKDIHDHHDSPVAPFLPTWINCIALGATILLWLIPWILFLRGRVWILGRIFFSHASFGLSPLIGMGISQYHLVLHKNDHDEVLTTTTTTTTTITSKNSAAAALVVEEASVFAAKE